MSVTVRIPTILRTYTAGASTVSADAGTVGQILQAIDANHPGVQARVVDEAGELRRFVNIYVGDEDVRFGDGLQTAVDDGVTVSIIPAVAGGAR